MKVVDQKKKKKRKNGKREGGRNEDKIARRTLKSWGSIFLINLSISVLFLTDGLHKQGHVSETEFLP